VAEWPAFFSGVYRSHVEVDLSSLHFPQDDKGRLVSPDFSGLGDAKKKEQLK